MAFEPIHADGAEEGVPVEIHCRAKVGDVEKLLIVDSVERNIPFISHRIMLTYIYTYRTPPLFSLTLPFYSSFSSFHSLLSLLLSYSLIS